MTVKTHHFRVGNGDMTLVELESGRRVLIDINIRGAADDEDDDTPDVAGQLRDLLVRDGDGRLYVDAFLLTHPDADHVRGLVNHFHLGAPGDWVEADDKILIREMWSSPIIFRRACKKNHVLDKDAKAWAAEARRRVALFREQGAPDPGDMILILGEDADGKTDDLEDILVKTGSRFGSVTGEEDGSFSALLLAPLPPSDDEDEEVVLSKNNSSVVVQLTLAASGKADAGVFLFGGDAEVEIWERIWDQYGDEPDDLAYDVLVAPHHCSWHSLSHDSWSQHGQNAQVSAKARKALGQPRSGAIVLASSCPVEDDDNDPPCIRAKREYVGILKPVGGEFRCVADGSGDEPFVFTINWAGPKPRRLALGAGAAASTGIGTEALAHG